MSRSICQPPVYTCHFHAARYYRLRLRHTRFSPLDAVLSLFRAIYAIVISRHDYAVAVIFAFAPFTRVIAAAAAARFQQQALLRFDLFTPADLFAAAPLDATLLRMPPR